MVTVDKMGGRTVELFIPYDWQGKKIERIVFKPLKLINTEMWLKGSYKSIMHLMSDLSDLPEETLRQLYYPDADRVMAEFVNLLPDEIKSWVIKGQVPLKAEQIQSTDIPWDSNITNGNPNEPHESLEDKGGFDLE